MKLLTPPGLAGIAILRVEPAECTRVFGALRRGNGGGQVAPAAGGPAVRAVLHLDGRDVDDVLVLARPDGTAELHVHGSPAVLDTIDAHFGVAVATMPRVAGDEHPANRLLAAAMSVAQFDLAVEQLRWDFDRELAEIDGQPAEQRLASLLALRERSRIAAALLTPCRVVLIGRQNAGKSTLFNHLLFRERAVTGATPGLTRDAIAEVTTLDGYPYELVDTAGEGRADTDQDADAIARGRRWRESALTVLVVDSAAGPDAVDRQLADASTFVVATKEDLRPATWPADFGCALRVSARSSGPDRVRAAFGEMLRRHRQLPPAGPVGGVAACDAPQRARLERLLDADEERA